MLYAKEIRNFCCLPSSYSRGQDIFSRADNTFLNYSCQKDQKDNLQVRADIRGSGSNVYETELVLDVSDPAYETIEGYRCTCPAYGNYDGMCKHCVALALMYRSRESERKRQERAVVSDEPKPATSPELASILARYGAVSANVSAGVSRGTVKLRPALTEHFSYVSGSQWCLSLQIGTSRMYVVKNQAALIHNILNGRYFQYGKQLGFVHAPEMFDEESRALLELLEPEVRRRCGNVDQDPYEGSAAYREIPMQEGAVQKLLALYSGRSLEIENAEFPIREGNPPLKLTVTPEGRHGAALSVSTLWEIVPGYYAHKGTLYHVTPEFTADALPFLRAVGALSGPSKTVRQYLSQADYQSFCGNLLPVLSSVLKVEIKDLDLSAYQPQKPEFFFYLSMDQALSLCIKPQVSYGAAVYPLTEVRDGQYRNAEAEQAVQSLLDAYFVPAASPGQLVCPREDRMYDFLRGGFEALRQFGEVFVEDSAKKFTIASPPQARVSVRLSGGLIDLTAQVEELPREEMDRLLNAYAHRKKFHRLSSGEFLSLEEGSLSVLSELTEVLQLQGQELTNVQIPAFRAQYLNALLTQPANGIALERTSDFKALVRRVRDYQDSDYAVPKTLHASLRGYQKAGFRWMCALADCGLGGILADDMGLGKTVQAIAYLLQRQGTALIVCPASLVYNWEAELHRFAPSLEVQPVLGAAPLRAQQIRQEADVYVTSYDLLRRDIDEYGDKIFDSCILDEAQYIRNAGTKLAQTAKQVNARIRFALTGTPIFNRLGDLWSIFDFLLPGYLYTYPKFREQIESPIAGGETAVSARLQRLTAPFILRRRKQDVLKELPEKVESVQYVEMSPEQRLLYRAQEQQLRLSLQGADDSEFRHKRIEFLAALTRLRQLCCTPELYLEGYGGGSGKVDACMELLSEAVDEGHKVLVFSQFTTMLDRLYQLARELGLSCLMLTGRNSKEQRREMVARFQAGQADVFFISLKAGGTGLNLTAADRIIHFDPWWNAAAEDQATDRAHRIGQDRTVFVTKLVAKDSVEERIIDLQNKKRALSDDFVNTPEAGDGAIGRDVLLSLLGSASEGSPDIE